MTQLILMPLLLCGFSINAFAVKVGEMAPAFELRNGNGKSISLTDYKGKTVVLEWLNHDCPYVKKHYGSGNMQALQKKYTKDGVIWLSIISSAPGKQGYLQGGDVARMTKEKNASGYAL